MSITEVEIIRQILKGTAVTDNKTQFNKDIVSKRSQKDESQFTGSIVSQGKTTKQMGMRIDPDYKLHGHPEHHPMKSFTNGKIVKEAQDQMKKYQSTSVSPNLDSKIQFSKSEATNMAMTTNNQQKISRLNHKKLAALTQNYKYQTYKIQWFAFLKTIRSECMKTLQHLALYPGETRAVIDAHFLGKFLITVDSQTDSIQIQYMPADPILKIFQNTKNGQNGIITDKEALKSAEISISIDLASISSQLGVSIEQLKQQLTRILTVMTQMAVTQPQKKIRLDLKVGLLTNNQGFGGVGRQAVFKPDNNFAEVRLLPAACFDEKVETNRQDLQIQGENDMDYRANDIMGLRTPGNLNDKQVFSNYGSQTKSQTKVSRGHLSRHQLEQEFGYFKRNPVEILSIKSQIRSRRSIRSEKSARSNYPIYQGNKEQIIQPITQRGQLDALSNIRKPQNLKNSVNTIKTSYDIFKQGPNSFRSNTASPSEIYMQTNTFSRNGENEWINQSKISSLKGPRYAQQFTENSRKALNTAASTLFNNQEHKSVFHNSGFKNQGRYPINEDDSQYLLLRSQIDKKSPLAQSQKQIRQKKFQERPIKNLKEKIQKLRLFSQGKYANKTDSQIPYQPSPETNNRKRDYLKSCNIVRNKQNKLEELKSNEGNKYDNEALVDNQDVTSDFPIQPTLERYKNLAKFVKKDKGISYITPPHDWEKHSNTDEYVQVNRNIMSQTGRPIVVTEREAQGLVPWQFRRNPIFGIQMTQHMRDHDIYSRGSFDNRTMTPKAKMSTEETNGTIFTQDVSPLFKTQNSFKFKNVLQSRHKQATNYHLQNSKKNVFDSQRKLDSIDLQDKNLTGEVEDRYSNKFSNTQQFSFNKFILLSQPEVHAYERVQDRRDRENSITVVERAMADFKNQLQQKSDQNQRDIDNHFAEIAEERRKHIKQLKERRAQNVENSNFLLKQMDEKMLKNKLDLEEKRRKVEVCFITNDYVKHEEQMRKKYQLNKDKVKDHKKTFEYLHSDKKKRDEENNDMEKKWDLHFKQQNQQLHLKELQCEQETKKMLQEMNKEIWKDQIEMQKEKCRLMKGGYIY